MSRSLLGAGLGATGATLYLKPEILQDWARDVMFGPSARPAGPGGKELEQLQRLVRRAQPPLAARGRTPRSACQVAALHSTWCIANRHHTPLLHPRKQVEDLSRQVAASHKGGVTVVHTSSNTTGRCTASCVWEQQLQGTAQHSCSVFRKFL